MKRIRSSTELQLALDEELVWRVTEIHALRKAISSAEGKSRTALIRASVPILYAHWEGFTKASTASFCSYISNKSLKYKDVSRSFRGIAALNYIRTLSDLRKKIFAASSLTHKIDAISEDDVRIDFSSHMGRIGNLKHSLFVEICEFINVKIGDIDTKRVLIDEALLERRNNIAHGEFLDVNSEDFDKLSEEVITLIRNFKTAIENSVATEAYRSDLLHIRLDPA